ncbi:MAG TPA: glycosyltransferase family 4 protein [Verrucomicrobiae bacterium]|jgi:glycosyltransferase involved in cell wall biosynthesis
MLAVFESHPVQYRAPVYRELQRLVPNRFHVFYATDVSVRGNRDVEFGQIVAWDEALLDGYPNTVLRQERGEPLKGFRSLRGKGLSLVFARYRPKAVLLTQFIYEYDFAALFHATVRLVPVWIRQETEDEANRRSYSKDTLRSIAYRTAYAFVKKAFFFGELNRLHLLRHGIHPNRLVRSPYCTQDRFSDVSKERFALIRKNSRSKLGIERHRNVVAFFGKLIPKKNPDLLLHAILDLKESLRCSTTVLFVGSGALEPELRARSKDLEKYGVQSVFAGFVNQSTIRDFYAASDIVVLPSRREGETWGLVVNEGLQAGCGVVISNAVGCGPEFENWERVRIIPEGDAAALARSLEQLAIFPREFDWARERMKSYSVESAANGLASEIQKLPN